MAMRKRIPHFIGLILISAGWFLFSILLLRIIPSIRKDLVEFRKPLNQAPFLISITDGKRYALFVIALIANILMIWVAFKSKRWGFWLICIGILMFLLVLFAVMNVVPFTIQFIHQVSDLF